MTWDVGPLRTHWKTGPLEVTNPIARSSVRLQAAELLTLFSAPTVLVPAPGAGFMVLLHAVSYEWNPGVIAYAAIVGNTFGAIAYNGDFTLATVVKNFFVEPDGLDGITPLLGYGVITSLPGVPTHGAIATALVENQPLMVTADIGDPSPVGPITTATLADGGTGYANGDTGTIAGSVLSGTAATYIVTGVALGVVTDFDVVTPGAAEYDTVSNPLTTTPGGAQPGGGSGFTVNVTAIPPADGDLYLTASYSIETLH